MFVKTRDINERRYLELYRTSSGPRLVDDQAERRPLLARPFQGLSLVRGGKCRGSRWVVPIVTQQFTHNRRVGDAFDRAME